MDIESAKTLSYENMRKMYMEYLQSRELGKNTVGTATGDAFYLWNNGGKDLFWNAVTADDFETIARSNLKKCLEKNSKGNVDKLLNGYVSSLKRFKNYVYSNDTEIEIADDAEDLKNFLLDIDCLSPLDEWTNCFNLFDILKLTRAEIRHSNMLSWLLNPKENHGLGDSVLNGFIQYVVTSFSESNDSTIFETLLMDCRNFVVQREWHNIDVLAVSMEHKFVLCIENKIDTGEHDNQLNRYKKIIEETYPDYKALYIYLSPDNSESSDPDNWCSMGYQDVLDIIEKARKKKKLLPDAELLVDNYMQTIRRDIVGDEKLAQICAEIYAKHQRALDLIFENKPDKASDLARVLLAWAKEKTEKDEITVVEDKCVKSYVRFKTAYMSSILPDVNDSLSGWNTHNYYFYEIRNNGGNEFFIQLACSSKNIPEDLRNMCNRINEFFPSKQQKVNWQWRIHFTSKHSKVDEEMAEEKIYRQLDKMLKEVAEFEAKLKENLEK